MLELHQPMVWSVGTQLAPERAVPPSAPEPPLTPPEPKPRRWRWLASVIAIVVLLAGWGISSALRARSRSGPAETIQTATVQRKEFVRGLRVTGTVEATDSYIVTAPTLTGGGFSSLIITRMAKAGSQVKKGEVIVEFDRQNQLKNALDRQAEFRDLEEQIKKKAAEQAIARAKDETELHQAEDAAKAAELETRRNEVVSKIDAEKNLANLEEGRAKLKQLQQTFELKRRAAKSELRVLEIQRDRSRNAMVHAESNAQKMEIHAPMDGVVVLNAIWRGGNQPTEVMEGDEVRSGMPFLKVMDPRAMRVRSRINQADIGALYPGEPVQVRLDAYPGLVLPGRVERIAAIGLTSGMSPKLRTFNAVFTIVGGDPKLMPDLTASIDVELARVADALVVPRDALFMDAGGSYVWLKRGSSFEREPVKVGLIGDTEATIVFGVDAGAVVLRNASSRQSSVASRQ